MKTPTALALLAILAVATSPAAAERACRPSLSNMYHCPDASISPAKPTKTTNSSGRTCRPSLSNLWTCPDTSRPSNSGASTPSRDGSGRACRPSLSNGYKCPNQEKGANQYSSERGALAHCSDTVVWANTRTNVYHFKGTFRYGNTVAGAYMCEADSLAQGMRAAKNETHP